MNHDTTPPIIVKDSSKAEQATTLARYIVTAIGSFALARGWIESDVAELLVALVTIVMPTAYGVYSSYIAKRQLVTVATAAPDSVARVVSTTP